MSDVTTLEPEILNAISGASDEGALEAVRVGALGKKGSISAVLATLGKMSPDERRTRGAEINARTRGGITSLMLGIINDRPDVVKLLLERGADINAQSGSGWTALSFAVWRGDDALVRVLLDHGAKPNLVDKQGWTPLDYATAKDAASDAGER